MDDIKYKLKKVNEIFVTTTRIKRILEDISESREYSQLLEYECEPICILVRGETGTGKSEFIKRYCASHPRIEEADRTKIPVLVSLLPKAKHPKPVVSQLLRDLGDPLSGTGADTDQLTDRLVILLKATGVELIILDEFQHSIETKSNQVVYDIADWIKTLINKAKIPVVLFGLPWSSYVLEVNGQPLMMKNV
ncbi:TniB family NTP-binding protein [Psychromonas ossibalaenae]|uniref:TniB family NTP-binding protein n=1 Tax=Psychromonas ossibalaenae TaxID=444922 RepID=UPI00037D6258|nr:TniB family NTP-binding protein [Psychromonas ossibalaenae]